MLGVTFHHNATVIPVFSDEQGVQRAGVLADEKVLSNTLLRRGTKLWYRSPISPPREAAKSTSTAIFAGYVINHFGHFLLDSLSRLWAAKYDPHIPIVWAHGPEGPNGNFRGWDCYTPWQEEILDILQIKNAPIFVSEPTTFARLAVPEPASQSDAFYSHEFDRFVSCAAPSEMVAGRKCWLSRSRVKLSKGGVIQEPEIEKIVRDLGWVVFHPEEHSVRKQLEFTSSCEIVAGWRGSAFHGPILLREVRSKFHVFQRGPTMPSALEMIAYQKRIDQTIHVVPMQCVEERGKKSVWSVDLGKVADVLRVI